MGILADLLDALFGTDPPRTSGSGQATQRPGTSGPRPAEGFRGAASATTAPPAQPVRRELDVRPQPAPSRVSVLAGTSSDRTVPYWQLRGWRYKGNGVWLGYFKTRLGRCHGVIKWRSSYDFGIYVHDLPGAILNGPHGACFEMVKAGKFRVHFAQIPQDLNSAIFYLETLLQEAFENGNAG